MSNVINIEIQWSKCTILEANFHRLFGSNGVAGTVLHMYIQTLKGAQKILVESLVT